MTRLIVWVAIAVPFVAGIAVAASHAARGRRLAAFAFGFAAAAVGSAVRVAVVDASTTPRDPWADVCANGGTLTGLDISYQDRPSGRRYSITFVCPVPHVTPATTARGVTS